MIEICEAMSSVETEKLCFLYFHLPIDTYPIVSKFDSQMALSNFLISQVSSRFHLPIKKLLYFTGGTNFKVVGLQTTKKVIKKNNSTIAKTKQQPKY